MTIEMGPVLRLQRCTGEQWNLSAIAIATDRECKVSFWQAKDGPKETIEPEILIEHGNLLLLRFCFSVPLAKDHEQEIQYSLDGSDKRWSVAIPALSTPDLRIAFATCNGFSSHKERRDQEAPYERWADLLDQHQSNPNEGHFHLLVMGGDQVYADPIWEKVPEVRKWTEKDGDRRWKRSGFSDTMSKQVTSFYFKLYLDSWGKQDPAMRTAMASIPTLMMWDDHDIFDGWGSYAEEKQGSNVYQGIYNIARNHFKAFQLHVAKEESQPNSDYLCTTENLTYAISLADVGILVLDLRSERTRDRVISSTSWKQIFDWLDNQGQLRHLLVVASVPVVHIDLSAFEWVTGTVNVGNLDDDLRDHWLSRAHKQERLRLIHRLFNYSESVNVRITLLSGDVHVGALGLLEKRQDENTRNRGGSIYQIISSPIVHSPPHQVMRWFYDWRASKTEEVAEGMTSRFIEMPASHDYYVRGRNWTALQIENTEKRRLWCNWRVEGDDTPYTHAISSRSSRVPGSKM